VIGSVAEEVEEEERDERDERDDPDGEVAADIVARRRLSVVEGAGTVTGTVVGGKRRERVTRTARWVSMWC